MACPSLLHSSASLLYGRFPSLATPSSARMFSPLLRNVVKASASGTVLVDKSEAKKTHRLKTAYLERIIHVLKDEFKSAKPGSFMTVPTTVVHSLISINTSARLLSGISTS